MKGSTFKRCKCRDTGGRELGTACPKLRRPDGSYAPGHGSWYFRLDVEPNPDGQRRTVRRGGFGSQREAQKALDDAGRKAARGVDVTRRLTVATYLTEWLDGKRNLRPTTMRSYRQHVEDVLVPALGRIELSQLRRTHVEAMLGELGVSAATRQRTRATLRSALNDAEREGLIVTNAARLARIESGKRPAVRPLEPAELGRLLDHVGSDELGALFEVIAATGLRRGEALGLRWVDVDLDLADVEIAVRQQIVQIQGHHDCPSCAGHNGLMFAEPKTASGARVIELDGHTVGVLLNQRLRQDADRERFGDAYADHDLHSVCVQGLSDGGLRSKNSTFAFTPPA